MPSCCTSLRIVKEPVRPYLMSDAGASLECTRDGTCRRGWRSPRGRRLPLETLLRRVEGLQARRAGLYLLLSGRAGNCGREQGDDDDEDDDHHHHFDESDSSFAHPAIEGAGATEDKSPVHPLRHLK